MPTKRPDIDATCEGRELNSVLKETVSASDAPSGTSWTPTLGTTENPFEPEVHAYMVISKVMSEKPPSQWHPCADGRPLSVNATTVCASMSPAFAMFQALAKKEITHAVGPWLLATIRLPAKCLLRLEMPIEKSGESLHQAEVRMPGDQWASEQQSLALRVPSAACPDAHNVLINTLHPDFDKVQIESFQPLEINSRMIR